MEYVISFRRYSVLHQPVGSSLVCLFCHARSDIEDLRSGQRVATSIAREGARVREEGGEGERERVRGGERG